MILFVYLCHCCLLIYYKLCDQDNNIQRPWTGCPFQEINWLVIFPPRFKILPYKNIFWPVFTFKKFIKVITYNINFKWSVWLKFGFQFFTWRFSFKCSFYAFNYLTVCHFRLQSCYKKWHQAFATCKMRRGKMRRVGRMKFRRRFYSCFPLAKKLQGSKDPWWHKCAVIF